MTLPDWFPVTQGQPTYVFRFRVLPEEGWAVTGIPIFGLTLQNQHFTVTMEFQEFFLMASVFGPEIGEYQTLMNAVRDQASALVDAMGFANAAAPSLVAESYVDPGGTTRQINSAFDGLDDHDGTFNRRLFHALLDAAWQSSDAAHVARAMADIRRAVLEATLSAVHAYRAIESIRQAYVLEEDRGAKAASWDRLRQNVSVPRSDLDWLGDLATPTRHGEPRDLSTQDRRRAISIARKVVRDHIGA